MVCDITGKNGLEKMQKVKELLVSCIAYLIFKMSTGEKVSTRWGAYGKPWCSESIYLTKTRSRTAKYLARNFSIRNFVPSK